MIIRLFVLLSVLSAPARLFAEPPAGEPGAVVHPDSSTTAIDAASVDNALKRPDLEARKALSDLPTAVLDKLSAAELVQVLEQREITKRGDRRAADPPAVAIIVPVALFLMVIAIVSLILRFRFRRHEKLHETMQKMIEKGIEIPPSLILPPIAKDADLRKGLVLTTLGLASANALFVLGPEGSWSLGLILVLPGLGYLAVWRYAQRRAES